MKLIKVIILLIIIQINTNCSSSKHNKQTSKRQSTDELRDEQMQDYENEQREMY